MVAVCFFFKADIVIGLSPVPVFDAEHQPFYAVPDKERNIEQFPLLGHMYEFVVNGRGVQRFFCQNELAQCYRKVILPKGESLDFQYLGHKIRSIANYYGLFSFMYSRGDMP